MGEACHQAARDHQSDNEQPCADVDRGARHHLECVALIGSLTTNNVKVPTKVKNAVNAVIRHTFSKVAMMLPQPNIYALGKTKMAILYWSVRCRTFPQKYFGTAYYRASGSTSGA
jgi:hypothetical protein